MSICQPVSQPYQCANLLQLGSDPIATILGLLDGEFHGIASSCKAMLHAVIRSGYASLRFDLSEADFIW